MPIAGSGTPKAEAARDAAGMRVWQAVHKHFSQSLDADAYSHIVGSIPEAVWDRSGQAELERTGSGLRIVLSALRLPDPHAGAPPGHRRSG